MADFVPRLRTEFLPADYNIHMQDELRARTQYPQESIIEFAKAFQGLFNLADAAASDAEKVARSIRQSHPLFHPHLRGRSFGDLDEMARAASTTKADTLAELRYRPSPPRSIALEPTFAWPKDPDEYKRHDESYESTECAAPRVLDPRAYESRERVGNKRADAEYHSENPPHNPQQLRGRDAESKG